MRQAVNLATAVLVLAAAFTLVACGDDDEAGAPPGAATTDGGRAYERDGGTTTREGGRTAPEPSIATIVLRNGSPVGGAQELTYDAGDRIRFRVRSDVSDEIHVHGYDVTQAVPAGGSATFAFPAEIEGIFEVESHEGEEQIAELRVEP